MLVRLRRELQLLRAHALITTPLLIVLSLAAFQQSGRTRFAEIDVERINIVEADGRLRLTISNRARLPDPVIGGQSYPLRSGGASTAAGMIFFNDEGNENGGLTWTGTRTDQGYRASAGMAFDQFDQDETVTLSYNDVNGRRSAGLTVTDRPNGPIQVFAESLMVIRSLPEGPARDRRMQQFRQDAAARGEAGARRLFVGKDADRNAIVMLADLRGRPRLRMVVDSLGAARLESLDQAGQVTHRWPGDPR
jgi:hypothetical protein